MYHILFAILISTSVCAKDKCETCKEMTDKFREVGVLFFFAFPMQI